MCACAERRAAMLASLSALRKADLGKAVAEARFVAVSSAHDVQAAAQAAARFAARARLSR